MNICKKYPWLLQAIYGPKRHHHIILSGIVKEDKDAVSTELPVAFVFVTPMHSNSGQPINVAFVTGNMVSVNMISGLTYLQYKGSIMDLNDNVMVMSKVGHSQFPIEYCVPQCSVLKVKLESSNKNKQATNTRYKRIRDELNGIEALVQCVHAAVIPGATPSSGGGALPTNVSKFDVQNGYWKLPIGLPSSPAYHLVAMAVFKREAGIGPQLYTEAVRLITAVGDEEWRADSADTSGAIDADMGHAWDMGDT